jgi:prepilin-type processing-associated H-X9-DG protein
MHLENLPSRIFSSASMPATSSHGGGVHVLMMDGTVRFVRNGIGLPVWRALSTRANGEAVSMSEL